MSITKTNSVYVAGHTGLVGSAITARLRRGGYEKLILRDEKSLDLTDAVATDAFFAEHKPEAVVLAAAKVGGIAANDAYPADFIRINLQIETNVIDAAYRHGVKKLLFLGSSCIYPKHAPQPMQEEHLLTGTLEPTNDAYALAKIAGIVMCKSYNRQHKTNFVAAMPTNLYGPGDNFSLHNSHVLPAMMRKFHEAKEQGTAVELWGSGAPKREFLYVDDLADALVFLLENYDIDDDKRDTFPFVNVGTGVDLSIRDLAQMIQKIVGHKGDVVWNSDMPDGTPRKLLDVSRMENMGWKAPTTLQDGIKKTYQWYLENIETARR